MFTLICSNRLLLSVVVILLSSLACTQAGEVSTATPASTATATPPPTRHPTLTPASITTDTTTATIKATVYARAAADSNSAEVGSLETGQAVVIVGCSGEWCEIEPQAEWDVEHAFVFRGCTDNNPDGLKCEVRK